MGIIMTRYKQIITSSGSERVAFTSDEEAARDTKEAAASDNEAPSYFAELRENRNQLLSDSDWTQAADTALTDSKKAEWVTYRDKLRKLPAQYDNSSVVGTITWPDLPS
jgi:hypothetical protein